MNTISNITVEVQGNIADPSIRAKTGTALRPVNGATKLIRSRDANCPTGYGVKMADCLGDLRPQNMAGIGHVSGSRGRIAGHSSIASSSSKSRDTCSNLYACSGDRPDQSAANRDDG
jgi:hypothetical protein